MESYKIKTAHYKNVWCPKLENIVIYIYWWLKKKKKLEPNKKQCNSSQRKYSNITL